MIRPMTDEERQRAKEKAMANKEQRDEDRAMSDLVKRLDQALHFEDWMPVPENFSEAVPLLQESRNRIEELSNCVAVLEAKLVRVIAAYRIEAMRREDYSHDAFDQHIAALEG